MLMQIHVVRSGETVTAIAALYGVAPDILTRYNGLRPPYRLAVGQSLLILFPAVTTVAGPGDTLFSLARRFQVSVLQLLRLNPQLLGSARLRQGETVVIALQNQGTRPVEVSGYAYPNVREEVLRGILPYATFLVPFSYGVGATGGLVQPRDDRLLALARQYGTLPLLHLSTITEEGSFSTQRASDLLAVPARQERLADAVVAQMLRLGYEGLDVDFEFVGRENAEAYAAFVGLLREKVNTLGYELITALAPKTSPGQPGVLYEGHDYAALAQNSDALLLMTYEWGYTCNHQGYMHGNCGVDYCASPLLADLPKEGHSVKIYFNKVLKGCFSRYVTRTRDALQITQEEMSEILKVSRRSYIDLEHEKAAPSGLSFAIYLAYLCDDPNKLAEDLRKQFDAEVERLA